MKIIKRKMTAEVDTIEGHSFCQASFNSDGVLTLRHWSNVPNNDIIIVLSHKETQAIFELLRQMKGIINIPDLPF